MSLNSLRGRAVRLPFSAPCYYAFVLGLRVGCLTSLIVACTVPSLSGDLNLYSLNPIYTAGFGKAGLSPQYKHFLGMKGKCVSYTAWLISVSEANGSASTCQ